MKPLLKQGLRRCIYCGEIKSLNSKNFYRNRSLSGRFRYDCIDCGKKRKQTSQYKEYKKEYNKRYSKTPKGIYRILSLRKNKKKIEISYEDFLEWYNSQEKVCDYCRIKEENLSKDKLQFGRNIRRLTIDRKDNNKGYKRGNLALACYMCNFVKGNIFTYEEMKKIGEIIKFKRKTRGLIGYTRAEYKTSI